MPQRESRKEKEEGKIDRKKRAREEHGPTPGAMNRHEVVPALTASMTQFRTLCFWDFEMLDWLFLRPEILCHSEVFTYPGNSLITILEVAHLAFILH